MELGSYVRILGITNFLILKYFAHDGAKSGHIRQVLLHTPEKYPPGVCCRTSSNGVRPRAELSTEESPRCTQLRFL